ncbi:hypothetical protein [Paenibacillus thalictri]|nr:hypothetical protein [Paenibacillus thalictri]
MIITACINYFYINPTFEAATLVTVNTIKLNNNNVIIKEDLNPFIEQVKSDFVLDKIITNLNLKQTRTSLKNSTGIDLIKNSNLIRIKVTGTDPSTISKISNQFAYQLGAVLEISDRSDIIVTNKKRLIEVEAGIKVLKDELAKSNELLLTTPEKLITKKSLAQDPYLQSVLSDLTSIKNKDLGALELSSEEINALYISLKTKISESTINLTKLETEQSYLIGTIKESENIISDLQTKSQSPSTNIYNSFKTVVITPSLQPENAVAPKKITNIAISGISTLILCLFVIIFREYWRETSSIKK